MPNNKYILNSLFIHHSSLRHLNINNRSISKKIQGKKYIIFFITIDFEKVLRSTTGEDKKKKI